ncbi:MAG: hypothetical protein GTO14_10265 [Anaerolineales bacterium]|nr:hypothetical protein [Anaerolineales bacterium]
MNVKMRSNLAAGLVLILIGVAFLIAQLRPEWFDWLDPAQNWPLIIIGVGLLLLFIGLLTGVPAMAVPACIVGGVGALLYWQNATGNWDSWAYAWALIPGFVGVGIILSGVLSGQVRTALRDGGRTILVSLVLVAIFGSFLGPNDFAGPIWPIVLIAAGVVFLFQAILRPR